MERVLVIGINASRDFVCDKTVDRRIDPSKGFKEIEGEHCDEKVKMLEIVFIAESLGLGGAERVVSVLSQSLLYHYNKVSVITFYKKQKEYELDKSVKRVNLNVPASRIGKLTVGAAMLYRYMKKNKNAVYISFDIFPNIISLMVNVILHRKLIVSERNAPHEAQISIASRILRKILYPTGRCFVFQTQAAKECYAEKIQGKGYVIGNPVKEGITNREPANVINEITAIGRLEKQKNYPLLLEAFKQFLEYEPDYKLCIYGEGSLRRELEYSIQEKELGKNVLLCGSRNNVHDFVKNAKLFVMTSDYEGMPNALMEAMAMGFPVISTDCPCGGPRELIRDGINGILVPVNDREELVKSMLYLCRNDIVREQMAERAKDIGKQYARDTITRQWVKCINKM